MTTETCETTTTTTSRNRLGPAARLAAYLELAKARLSTMVVLTTIAGFVLASPGEVRLARLVATAVGTALAAFAANILNQWREVEQDRLMHRTKNRPLPAGTVTRRIALRWGLLSAVAGVATLAAGANLGAASLALGNILLYVLVYTPLKQASPLNTAVGAACGAVPPMIGWVAAAGRLDPGAWLLAAVLFLWQIPHFMALAWMYREDYARAGFRMLPAIDRRGRLTGAVALVTALGLIPVCVALYLESMAGPMVLVVALALTAGFSSLAGRFSLQPTTTAARHLFLSSLLYLPLLLGTMVADRPVPARPAHTVRAAVTSDHPARPLATPTRGATETSVEARPAS